MHNSPEPSGASCVRRLNTALESSCAPGRKLKIADGHERADVVHSLLSISKGMRALVGLKLHEVGFHVGQDELLLALEEEQPISVSALAQSLSVRPSPVSRTLDRLQRAGLLERAADIGDGRRTLVRITPTGLDVQGRFRELRDRLEVELTNLLGTDTGGTIAALETVSADLQARLRRRRLAIGPLRQRRAGIIDTRSDRSCDRSDLVRRRRLACIRAEE